MGKSITEITNEWSASVNEVASNVSNSISAPMVEGINNLFGGASDGITDSGNYPKFKVLSLFSYCNVFVWCEI